MVRSIKIAPFILKKDHIDLIKISRINYGGKGAMEFSEKARIRLEHWLKHNKEHEKEYRRFRDELLSKGKTKSAKLMESIIEHVSQCSKLFEEAIDGLNKDT